MSNTPILDLPVAIGVTGAEWVPCVQGIDDDATTKRFQLGLIFSNSSSIFSTEPANKVFAGPVSGSASAPTFRSLVEADLPYSTVTVTTTKTIDATQFGALLLCGGGTVYTITFGAASGFPTGFYQTITNTDTFTLPKKVVLSGGSYFWLYGGETATISKADTAWVYSKPQYSLLPGSTVNMYVDPALGSDDNDGFAAGAGRARASCYNTMYYAMQNLAWNSLSPTVLQLNIADNQTDSATFHWPPHALLGALGHAAFNILGATRSITGAANNGSGLIRLTIGGSFGTTGYTTGKSFVRVQNVGGVTGSNGSFLINVIDATHVDLVGSTFGGAYTSGGTITGTSALASLELFYPTATVELYHLNVWALSPNFGANVLLRDGVALGRLGHTGAPVVANECNIEQLAPIGLYGSGGAYAFVLLPGSHWTVEDAGSGLGLYLCENMVFSSAFIYGVGCYLNWIGQAINDPVGYSVTGSHFQFAPDAIIYTNLTDADVTYFPGTTAGTYAGMLNYDERPAFGSAATLTDFNLGTDKKLLATGQTLLFRQNSSNYFLGTAAGNDTATGTFNSGFGGLSLTALTSGTLNTGVGQNALQSLTTGSHNTAIGVSAANAITTGSDSTAVGYQALLTATGSSNAAFGYTALYGVTTGQYNVGLGREAGQVNTTGSNNVYVGLLAGLRDSVNATPSITGSGNIVIGTSENMLPNHAGSAQLNIGNILFGTGLTQGFTVSSGRVGIKVIAPAYYDLEVGGTAGVGAAAFNKMTVTAPATGSTFAVADGKTVTHNASTLFTGVDGKMVTHNATTIFAGTDGKTLTLSNSVTLSGTDGSTMAFGAGGTVAYTGNNLSAFAATTSAQLAGVISDETGSGVLVFATSPTLTTPVLGAATGTSLVATNQIWSGSVSSALSGLTGATDGFRSSAANVTGMASENTTASSSTQGAMVGMYSNDGAAMASGDRLGGIRMGGSSSASAMRNSAGVFAFAAEAWADGSAYGSRLEFQNTTNGATTLSTKAILSNAGLFALGATLANTVPAIKPSSTTLQVRLGDDSAYAALEAGNLGAGGVASATTFLNLAAGTTAASPIRFIQGAAPTSPVDGDMWREDNTNTGLKIRINGVTKTVTVS